MTFVSEILIFIKIHQKSNVAHPLRNTDLDSFKACFDMLFAHTSDTCIFKECQVIIPKLLQNWPWFVLKFSLENGVLKNML